MSWDVCHPDFQGRFSTTIWKLPFHLNHGRVIKRHIQMPCNTGLEIWLNGPVASVLPLVRSAFNKKVDTNRSAEARQCTVQTILDGWIRRVAAVCEPLNNSGISIRSDLRDIDC